MTKTISDFEGETISKFQYKDDDTTIIVIADYINKRASIEVSDYASYEKVVINDIGIRELGIYLNEVMRRIDKE